MVKDCFGSSVATSITCFQFALNIHEPLREWCIRNGGKFCQASKNYFNLHFYAFYYSFQFAQNIHEPLREWCITIFFCQASKNDFNLHFYAFYYSFGFISSFKRNVKNDPMTPRVTFDHILGLRNEVQSVELWHFVKDYISCQTKKRELSCFEKLQSLISHNFQMCFSS